MRGEKNNCILRSTCNRSRGNPRMTNNEQHDRPESIEEEPEAPVPFCPPGDEERQDFLRRNYVYLCTHIETRRFYAHLKSQQVIDKSDQEEIDRGYRAERDRNQELIDRIMTRGENAFIQFMTVLEYDYPEQYREITKHQPREPPKWWKPEWKPRSSANFNIINGIAQALEQHFNDRRRDEEYTRRQLMEMKNRISVTEEEATKEVTDLKNQLYDIESKLERTTRENELLHKQLSESKRNEAQHETELTKTTTELNALKSKLEMAKEDVTLERDKSRRYNRELQKQTREFVPRSASANVTDTVQNLTYETEVADLTSMVESQKNKIAVQKSELQESNARIEELLQKLQNANVQYDVLEDDYKGDKKRSEESIERQNVALRIVKEDYRRLEKEKRALQERLKRLEESNIASPHIHAHEAGAGAAYGNNGVDVRAEEEIEHEAFAHRYQDPPSPRPRLGPLSDRPFRRPSRPDSE